MHACMHMQEKNCLHEKALHEITLTTAMPGGQGTEACTCAPSHPPAQVRNHTHTCASTHMSTCTHARTHARSQARSHASTLVHKHACARPHMHTAVLLEIQEHRKLMPSLPILPRACMHASVRACMSVIVCVHRACMCARVLTCMRAPVCVCICFRAYVSGCVLTCLWARTDLGLTTHMCHCRTGASGTGTLYSVFHCNCQTETWAKAARCSGTTMAGGCAH